jgi:hypothetical protein
MNKAVFDQDAFYPFRRLIHGGISEASDLPVIERFLRAIVLHDEMVMIGQPMPRPSGDEEEWTEEEIERGGRNVIVGFAPVLDGYEGLLSTEFRVDDVEVTPSQRLVDLAAELSGAGPDDPYYKAHLGYLKQMTGILATGGSVVCEGDVGTAAFEQRDHLPEGLFAFLDADWGAYAQSAQEGLDLIVPPVLAIVLSRAARRERLLDIIRDLRNEWSEPRRKVWNLLSALRSAETIKETNEVRAELKAAATLFSPSQAEPGLSPVRVLWDVFAVGAVGVATGIASGSPEAGVAAALGTAAKDAVEKSIREVPVAGRYWLGTGAFDLARRVRREMLRMEIFGTLLNRHLSTDEKKALGL